MKKWLVGLTCLVSSIISHADPIVGIWRTIDDKTGFSKALVEIKQQPDGTYDGTIIKVIPRPNYTPKELCQKCPAPFTDKPIVGLTLLWGLKKNADNPNIYTGAQLIDPLSGKMYKGKVKVSGDGRQLILRGYVGVSVLGRSQIWIRDK